MSRGWLIVFAKAPRPGLVKTRLSPPLTLDQCAELYQAMLDPESARVDNILKIHSLNPRALAAHDALYQSAMAGTAGLRKVEREMIALVVSSLNECEY